MRTVGVLGGFGPESTAEFYLKVIVKNQKLKRESRPSILIHNAPVILKIEERLIKSGKGIEKFLPWLLGGIRILEDRCDFIVMPCNTLHFFIEKLRKECKIPILSIMEEVAKDIKNKNISKVGLLATAETVKEKLFEMELNKNGIKIVTPDERDQNRTSEIINSVLKGIKTEKMKKELLEVIAHLKMKGTEAIILGCTELPLVVKQKDCSIKLFDTMDTLANSTAKLLR